MKQTFRSIKALLTSGLLLVGLVGSAQTYPFPQNVTYSFGLKPTNASSNDALAAYTSWKSTYVKPIDCSTGTPMFRVTFDDPGNPITTTPKGDITVSEGMGYGMLLTAYFGDKATFDGLWAYYKYNMTANTKVMNWYVTLCNQTPIKPNGATDADLDAAWALNVAHYQFGGAATSQYLTDCKSLIAAIKKSEVESGSNILKPGDAFGGSVTGTNNDIVNLSYFSPAYFRQFGIITNDQTFWNSVVSANYALLNKAKNSTTGLVPDWCKGSDGTSAPAASGYYKAGNNVYYDAVRVPFRISLDYLWNGAPEALAYTKLVNNWLKGLGSPANLHTEYTTAGVAADSYHNNTFVGCFSAITMANDLSSNQTIANSYYTDNKNTNPAATGAYFNASWKALSLLLQTGNFYLPPPDLCEDPFLSPSYDLCSSSSQSLDCGISGGTYVWKLNGAVISGATSQVYNATKAGSYEVDVTVQVNGKPCIRRATTVVNPAKPTSNFTFAASGLSVNLFDNSSTGLTRYNWKFGTGASPSTYRVTDPTTQTLNPVVQYATSGLKLVTLTVTDVCKDSVSFTQEITIGDPNSTAGGWIASNFIGSKKGSNVNVFSSSILSGSTPNPNIILDDSTFCKYIRANVSAAAGYYDPISLGFKDPSSTLLYNDYPIDITTYPYARFRIRISKAVDSIRIDLQDKNFKSTDWKPLFLKGERNADGTYKPIPVNQWFISTVDFTGRFFTGTTKTAIDSKNIQQLQFLPFAANDPKAIPTAKARQAIIVDIDWAIVGNKAFPAPDLSGLTSPVVLCTGASQLIGIDTLGCGVDFDNVSWSNGASTPQITVSTTGLYTITATNFGGESSKDINVSVQGNAKSKFVYTTPAQGSVSVTDSSVGIVTGWSWYKNPTTSTTPTKIVTTAGSPNLSTLIIKGQTPATFTGISAGQYVCLRITSQCYAQTLDRDYCIPITFVLSGLEEELNSSTTNVYPTVVEDNLNIVLGGSLSGTFDVKVADILGVTHSTTTIGIGLSSINVSNLPSGSYLLNIKQGNNSITKKFIKQ